MFLIRILGFNKIKNIRSPKYYEDLVLHEDTEK